MEADEIIKKFDGKLLEEIVNAIVKIMATEQKPSEATLIDKPFKSGCFKNITD